MIKNTAQPGILLALAQKYVDLKFALVPVVYGGKAPCSGNGWNKAENLVTTAQGCRKWWKDTPRNIGVNLGASGLMSLDLDQLEKASEFLKGRGVDLGAEIAAHTASIKGRGLRLMYRGNVLSRQVLLNGRETVLEIRGGNGFQDVLPGSLHPSGVAYEWMREPQTRQDIPEAPAWLLRLYSELEQAKKQPNVTAPSAAKSVAVGSGEKKLYQLAQEKIDLRERLRRHGYKDCGPRMISPNSSSNEPGVIFNEKDNGAECLHSFHTSDVLTKGDVVDVIANLEHGGDYRAAYRAIALELGVAQGSPQSAQTEWQNVDAAGLLGAVYAALMKMRGSRRTKHALFDLYEILLDRARHGHLAWVDGSMCVMTGGTTGLKALGAGGSLTEIGFRLRALGEIGLLDPVTRGSGLYDAYRIRIAASPQDTHALLLTDEELADIEIPCFRKGRDKKRGKQDDDSTPGGESHSTSESGESAMGNPPSTSAARLLSSLLRPLALAESGQRSLTLADRGRLALAGVSTYQEAREKLSEERDFDPEFRIKILNMLRGSIYPTICRLNDLIRSGRFGAELQRLKDRLADIKERISRIEAGERVSAVLL